MINIPLDLLSPSHVGYWRWIPERDQWLSLKAFVLGASLAPDSSDFDRIWNRERGSATVPVDSEKSKALAQLSVEAEPVGFLPFSTSFCFTTGFGRLQAAQATWSWAAVELQKRNECLTAISQAMSWYVICFHFASCTWLKPNPRRCTTCYVEALWNQPIAQRAGWEIRTLDCFSSKPSFSCSESPLADSRYSSEI